MGDCWGHVLFSNCFHLRPITLASEPVYRDHHRLGYRPDTCRCISAVADQGRMPEQVPPKLIPLPILQRRTLWFGPDGRRLREVLCWVLLGDDRLPGSLGLNGAGLDGSIRWHHLRREDVPASPMDATDLRAWVPGCRRDSCLGRLTRGLSTLLAGSIK